MNYGWMTHARPDGDGHAKDARGRERFPGLPTASKRKNQAMERTRARANRPGSASSQHENGGK